MPTLGVSSKLDLVDREEIDIDLARHRLDGRNPESRVFRLDLLLAGDQRDLFRPHPCRDLVIDLAREQTQRQPDHTRVMAEHALDRQVRLAGVGRSQNGGDVPDPRFKINAHVTLASSLGLVGDAGAPDAS